MCDCDGHRGVYSEPFDQTRNQLEEYESEASRVLGEVEQVVPGVVWGGLCVRDESAEGEDTDRETERPRDRETERQRDRETERQRDRETLTERERERASERDTHARSVALRVIACRWTGCRPNPPSTQKFSPCGCSCDWQGTATTEYLTGAIVVTATAPTGAGIRPEMRRRGAGIIFVIET